MNQTPGLCQDCKSTGLPILPVRYAVIPNHVRPALPDWACGERVRSVGMGMTYTYALRTMRAGFIYLFYAKHARGPNYWECYTISGDGSLIKQPSTFGAQPYSEPTLTCANNAHLAGARHAIVIEQPHKCGTTWIAYSQEKWCVSTLNDYTANDRLRDARMQRIEPSRMIEGDKTAHGAALTKDALEGVLEYAPQFNARAFPHEGEAGLVSDERGAFASERLGEMSTIYPWFLRPGQAASTSAHLQRRAQKAGGLQGIAHVLALWDAIGIVHELNGFRNDAAGRIKKYVDERALQITAIQNYEVLKSSVMIAADTWMQDHVRKGAEDGPMQEREQELKAMAEARPQDLEVKRQLDATRGLIRLFKANSDSLGKGAGQSAATLEWAKYQTRLLPTSSFQQAQAKFEKAAEAIVEQRTRVLVDWLDAALFVDTLKDFHRDHVPDGVTYERVVGQAIHGMGSCPSGQKKIEAWVNDPDPSAERNLLWRAIGLNQDDACLELAHLVKTARAEKTRGTYAKEFDTSGFLLKSMKSFANMYKKSVEAYAKVRIAPSNPLGPVDRLMLTSGDAIFKALRIDKIGDFASEKLLQHALTIRSFVSVEDSISLVEKQAQMEALSLDEQRKRIAITKVYMNPAPDFREVQERALRGTWAHLIDSSPDENSAIGISRKQMRLSVVIGLVEALNFGKLLSDAKKKGDYHIVFELLCSSMTIASAMFEVAAGGAKVLFDGSVQNTHGNLKLAGGLLSSGASFVGAILDLESSDQRSAKGYGFLGLVLWVKGAVGLVTSALGFAVSYSYASAAILRIAGANALTKTAEKASARAIEIIGLRILGMTIGGALTWGLLAADIVITWMTPSVLEEWIDRSAFGSLRQESGFKTAAEQLAALELALKGVALK